MTFRPATYFAEAIRQAVSVEDLIDPMGRAFRVEADAQGESTISVLAPRGEDGDVHVKTAWVPGHRWYVVKVASAFTVNRPERHTRLGGFLALHDVQDGALRALLLDEHRLTDLRTAAASAAATRALSPATATSVAVLGSGTQALLQALATARVRPITDLLVWGRRLDAAERVAAAIRVEAPYLRVVVTAIARAAVEKADIVLTTTSSRAPIVAGEWLRPGQHVTATGADDPSKTELDPACFARADVVAVDSPRLTPQVAGDLRAAIAAGGDWPQRRMVALGHVDPAYPTGRDASHITIAKLVGNATQDLLAAETTLRRLTAGA